MNDEVEKAKQRLEDLAFKKNRSEGEEKEYKELRERIANTGGGTEWVKKLDEDSNLRGVSDIYVYSDKNKHKVLSTPESSLQEKVSNVDPKSFSSYVASSEDKFPKESIPKSAKDDNTPNIDYAEGKMKNLSLYPLQEKVSTEASNKEIEGSSFQEGVTVGENNAPKGSINENAFRLLKDREKAKMNLGIFNNLKNKPYSSTVVNSKDNTANPETETTEETEETETSTNTNTNTNTTTTGENDKDANYKAAVVAKMQENIEKNKGDIIGNKLINDAISVAEYFHNKKEPPYQRGSVPDVPFMVGQRISADPYLQDINRGKIAAIRNLRAAGRQDLIPTVLKQADNKAAEIRGSIDAKNAELKMAADNANMGAMMQGIQLGVSNRHFDEQMHAQHEAMRGAAQSENITNIRKTLSDYQNSMTKNRDNEISNMIYALAAEDPEILKSLGAWLEKRGGRSKAAYDEATVRRYAQIKEEAKQDARNKPLTYGGGR